MFHNVKFDLKLPVRKENLSNEVANS